MWHIVLGYSIYVFKTLWHHEPQGDLCKWTRWWTRYPRVLGSSPLVLYEYHFTKHFRVLAWYHCIPGRGNKTMLTQLWQTVSFNVHLNTPLGSLWIVQTKTGFYKAIKEYKFCISLVMRQRCCIETIGTKVNTIIAHGNRFLYLTHYLLYFYAAVVIKEVSI